MRETEQNLRARLGVIQAKLHKIESSRRISYNRKLVGKCFKYLNSYGGDSAKWWLYVRVTRGGVSATCIEFQRTSMDIFEMRANHWFSKNDGHIEIPRVEYDAALRVYLREQKEAIKK